MPMKYEPHHGFPIDIELSADEYRAQHPDRTWLYNPWTGNTRTVTEIEQDPHGYQI